MNDRAAGDGHAVHPATPVDDPVGGSSAESRFSRQRLRLVLLAAGPIVVLLIGVYVYFFGSRYETTDDARVRAAQVSISANVAGRVSQVAVRENQAVRRGETLFQIDGAPYRLAVADAEAQLASARLEVQGLKAAYRQQAADVVAARDTLEYRRNEADRQQRLLTKGISSQSQFDAATYASQSANQQYISAEQQLAAALVALSGEPNIDPEAHPAVLAAQARANHARLDLSYTTVVAPQDGIVTRVEALQVGSYINASQPVFALVSTTNIWIEANFKEVQLAHVRTGQSATVKIDALPGRTFEASVVSVSPGTGSEFAVLPAENATGNWVKVVQRVPIRLQLTDHQVTRELQSGLSAVVTVDTRFRRRLFGADPDVELARHPATESEP